MSRKPWTAIQKEALRWDRLTTDQFNKRTLEQLGISKETRNLLRDVKRLDALENLPVELSSDAIKIPCPICKSTKFLVPSFGHPKILVCDRPNCTYERTRQKTYEITAAQVRRENVS